MRLSVLLSRISLFAALPALIVALCAILCVRFGVLSLAAGMNLMIPAAALALVAFVAGGVWTWMALRANDSRGWRFGAVGFAVALAILAPAANDTIRRFSSAPLVDITTNPGEPPQFVAVLPERTGADNPPGYDGDRKLVYAGKETTAIAVQKKAYPSLRPYAGLVPRVESPKTVMFWRAFEAAKRMGWHIVSFDEKTGHIEATDSSLFFGTKDDIAIDVRPAGKTGARVEVRSKSRMGDNDRGANAARIKSYVQEIGRR
jgi:hypothetical protein